MTAKLNPSQLQSYLDAIQLPDEELQPTLATLTAVHRQHSRNIPFANVTVAREPPQLIELSFPKETPGTSTDAILEKLVYRKWYECLSQEVSCVASKQQVWWSWAVRGLLLSSSSLAISLMPLLNWPDYVNEISCMVDFQGGNCQTLFSYVLCL